MMRQPRAANAMQLRMYLTNIGAIPMTRQLCASAVER